jgi:hypothetical protein
MDGFELKPERTKVNLRSLVWNILTVVVLLCIGSLAVYFLVIFTYPNLPLNPFPPAQLPTLYLTDTPTSTLVVIPREATWTPPATISPLPSRTKAPTWTLLPQMVTLSTTPTTTVTPAGGTPAITSTPLPVSLDITYLASTAYRPDMNCEWLGIAGKVLGTDGKPLLYQEIQLGGTLDGKPKSLFTLSGSAQAYGPSGFELVLSDHPIASTQTLWIQLLDNTAKPLTNRIYIDTYTGCTQNLVMVVYTKNR